MEDRHGKARNVVIQYILGLVNAHSIMHTTFQLYEDLVFINMSSSKLNNQIFKNSEAWSA